MPLFLLHLDYKFKAQKRHAAGKAEAGDGALCLDENVIVRGERTGLDTLVVHAVNDEC